MATKGTVKTTKWNILLNGIRPIMFDRFSGDMGTQLQDEDKMYLRPGTKEIVLPVENVLSFLSATNTISAPKQLLGQKEYGKVCRAFQCFTEIEPIDYIPFTRKGKKLVLGKWVDGADTNTGMFFHHSVARLKGGVPNPKIRPVLPLPWSLAFSITIMANPDVGYDMLKRMLSEGGMTVGFGTFRGRYGKFQLEEMEEV